MRSISRCSWPKPFTTLTPLTASSTFEAISPTCCCTASDAGNTHLRSKPETKNSSGTMNSVTSVSEGDRKAITTSDRTSCTTLDDNMGNNANN